MLECGPYTGFSEALLGEAVVEVVSEGIHIVVRWPSNMNELGVALLPRLDDKLDVAVLNWVVMLMVILVSMLATELVTSPEHKYN